MRRRRLLTYRGVGALLAGAVCVVAANLTAAPILLYLSTLLFALVILAALVVRVPRRSGSVTRRISSDLLTVGEESQVNVRFDLRSLRVPNGIWRDRLPAVVSGDAVGEFPTDNGTHLSYRITGNQRGIWAIGPLTLHTIDPFGFAQREQEFGESRTITVVPEVVPLAPLSSIVGAAGGTAHTSSTRLGQGSDNLSPRRYVAGDSMRRIHWRASAHRGDLMVRQEEEETSPDALVILDRTARRWPAATGQVDSAFEAAVSACASVALHLVHEGYSVDVIDSAGSVLGTLRGHEDDRDDLLVALAHVVPGGEGREIVTLYDGTPPGPLVLITGQLEDEDAAVLRHGGAAAPILLAAQPLPGAMDAAAARGWSSAQLTDDVASAWEDALPARMATGGGHVTR